MTLLDEILPSYDVRERHSIAVDAPADRVFAAVWSVTLAETPVARPLIWLRGIRADPARPILEQALVRFELIGEEPGREIVLGSVGQPWDLKGGETPRGDFRTFGEPGFAKMAINFRVDGRTLSTETRVLATDEASRRRFRRYWLLIRPASGLIRRVWLRAIKRRAEGLAG